LKSKALLFIFLIPAAAFTAKASPIVQDSSFENITSPSFPYYNYTGGFSSPNWIFSGNSGVDPSSGTWFSAPPPDGRQAAFLQNVSSFSQLVTGFVVGNVYQVTYQAAERPAYVSNGIDVSLGGIDLGTFTPAGTGFVLVTTSTITATSTSMNLAFAGTFTTGDHDSAIDVVSIADVTPGGVPEPSTMLLGAIPLAAFALLRRKRTA